MSRDIHSLPPAGGNIYTLAQTGTIDKPRPTTKREIIVKGNGTEAQHEKRQNSRAKRKMVSQKLMLCLIDVAIHKRERERTKPYWNTYHCQNRVIQSGGRIYGDYCKNRFCTVCSGIRKADIINRYLPVIQTWEAPYFVTLTAVSVPACKLKSRIDRMLKSLRKILARNKKRAQRGTEIKLKGIRSLESNFNPQSRTYNPHFHFIVENKQMAEILIYEWLKQSTPSHTIRIAQDMRPVTDLEHDLIEIVKYATKIFTDPTMLKKSKEKAPAKKVTRYVYVSAMDNIITAMSGHRVFERFGFNLPKAARRPPGGKQTKLTNYTELNYDSHLFDWIDSETEKLLSGFVPNRELIAIFESYIDKDLE